MASPSQRPFGFWTATALVVGGMIGSGIFVLPGQLAPYGWTSVAAWIAGIAGAMLIAWVLARLTVAFPGATGVVAICGEGLGPVCGVLVGWSYWVGIWSANAVIALTAVRYLAQFVPALAATTLSLAVSATGLIWLLTLLNLGGARLAGLFQVTTTVLKLLPLVAVLLILAGVALTAGDGAPAAARPGFAWAELTPALTLAFFAIVGFEAASVAAERVRDPARNVVRATLFGLALTGALYIIVCSGIIFVLPTAPLAAAQAPFALFVATYWGGGAGLATAAFAAIAAIGALNGWTLVQGEVPLGMARAGLLPRWIGRTSARDVPIAMLLVSSALASLLVLSNATRSLGGLLDFMLRLTAAATIWLYVGACLTALIKRIVPAAAAAGLAFAGWALWGAGLEAVGLSLGLMVTALPLYLLRVAPD
ncbi:amino acid permease [Sphingomonas sp. TREG-RG-20F-R18-01]|uniref:APC family permease n=1 Tax=Sphingomonas sp. TREG-RG-20F-R18-01 TaxID=2914982 RepID=UPI0032216C2B